MRKRYTPKKKAQIVLKLLKEERSVSEISSEYGIHANQLYKWRSQALEGLPGLFENDRKTEKTLRSAHEKEKEELYAHIGRLTTQLNWLKKNLASSRSRKERLAMLDRNDPKISLGTQTELLNISRSSLYYKSVGPSAREIAFKQRIDEIYTAHPFYGSRRITVVLKREGRSISRPTVQRYMREMNIAGIAPGPNLSKRRLEDQVYPYLLRNVPALRPNHVWGIDITYIRLSQGWMYLVAVLDWFSRYVVSWQLDQSLEMTFVLDAVDQALQMAQPEIWNSDQGSHFTSPQYID